MTAVKGLKQSELKNHRSSSCSSIPRLSCLLHGLYDAVGSSRITFFSLERLSPSVLETDGSWRMTLIWVRKEAG